jgi:hypothetical protein
MTSVKWFHLAAMAGCLALTSTPALAAAAEPGAVPDRLLAELTIRMLTPMALDLSEAGCVVALLPAASGEAAEAKEPGEKWEVTTQMVMEGMPMAMPPHTSTVCSPKEWKEPPAGDQGQKCTYTDFHMEGNKATWKVSCAGPPAMTGDGEITRDADGSFKGTMNFTSEGNKITIKMSGKKVGTCEI